MVDTEKGVWILMDYMTRDLEVLDQIASSSTQKTALSVYSIIATCPAYGSLL
jgi:hypothetical protein